MKGFKKCFYLAVAVFVLLSSSAPAFAASWPAKPVNFVVAFAAGGNSDYNARAIAKYLSKELGQPVVVSNIAGSGGSIAAAQVKDAKADGYTVLVSQISMNIAEAVGMVNFGYRDFSPVCVFSRAADEVLVVRADAPWNSLQELIEDTKKNPGKYKLTANTGASTQWTAVGLQGAGARFNVVSSGGSGERLTLLLGKHVDIIPMPWNMVEDYVKTNKFKVLATVSPERSPQLPGVPSLKELGIGGSYYYYNTLFMPKGTDPAVVEALSKAVEKIVGTNDDYRKEMAGFMQKPTYLNTEDTVSHYRQELDALLKISDQLKGVK